MSRWNRGRSGGEPTSARSPLRLRAVLAGVALAIAILGLAWFGWFGSPDSAVVAIGFAVLGLIAAINLVVLLRRWE